MFIYILARKNVGIQQAKGFFKINNACNFVLTFIRDTAIYDSVNFKNHNEDNYNDILNFIKKIKNPSIDDINVLIEKYNKWSKNPNTIIIHEIKDLKVVK